MKFWDNVFGEDNPCAGRRLARGQFEDSRLACTNREFSAEFLPTFIVFATNFATAAGCVWTKNRWWVPSNGVWGLAAHNGWYWIPNATAVSGTDDTQFVQQAVL